MAAHMPTEPSQLARLHGVGTHKLEAYGDQFLTAIRHYLDDNPGAENERIPIGTAPPATSSSSVKRPLGETYQVTLSLLRQGKSIEQIASIREIVPGTVEGHIARLIEEGEPIEWQRYVPTDTDTLLRQLFEIHGSDPLSPAIEAAAGAASYGQAKIVRAVMELEASAD